MTERAGMPIQALKSIAFQYSPVEDRIRCIATPSGVSLEEPRFWLTQRLAFRFMDEIHKRNGAAAQAGAPDNAGQAPAQKADRLLDYGRSFAKAKFSTASQVGSIRVSQGAQQEAPAWLVERMTLKRRGERSQVVFIGKEQAVGLVARDDELLRLIDMLETAFQTAGWPLPSGSYRYLGAAMADSEGQSLN